MSLLDRGQETITVYPAGPAGPDGAPAGEGAPVTVRCQIQPAQADESDLADGFTVGAAMRVIARRLPPGPWARVVWQGREWTVLGEPQQHRTSPRTSHDIAVIRRR